MAHLTAEPHWECFPGTDVKGGFKEDVLMSILWKA